MRKSLQLLTLAAAAMAAAMTIVVGVQAEPPNHANRLEATFAETPASITDHVADLGVFQLILTGTGTVAGFGAATEVAGVTQDRAVHPCGVGSDSEAVTRRIVTSDGTLALREVGAKCPSASGPVFTATYEVDGLSSTGVFAGARGNGTDTVDISTHTDTLSGELNLA
jgi:hypothetical protein